MSESQEAVYLEPLRQEMSRVEATITSLEEQLAELRKERTGLGHALRALDPQWAANHPRAKSGPKPRSRAANPVAPQTRDQVLAYLRERFEPGDDITGPMIHGRADSPATHSVVTRALRQLHDEGVLRLDRMGDGQSNRTKIYRLADA